MLKIAGHFASRDLTGNIVVVHNSVAARVHSVRDGCMLLCTRGAPYAFRPRGVGGAVGEKKVEYLQRDNLVK